jgi:hypothetical protein
MFARASSEALHRNSCTRPRDPVVDTTSTDPGVPVKYVGPTFAPTELAGQRREQGSERACRWATYVATRATSRATTIQA